MRKPAFVDLHRIARQAMIDYGFEPRFSPKVIKEVETIEEKTFPKTLHSPVYDYRSLLWSSIDNWESKDLDQLEYCELGVNREIRVMVAIADVDSYVGKGSVVDEHAAHNATSVYTGVDIFPMLPQRLSTDLSSLIEGAERYATVIEFFVRKDGSVRPGSIVRAVVANKAKLVYESVGEWLEEKGEIPPKVSSVDGLEEQLRIQNEAAKRLYHYRMDQGALELETIEAVPVMDGDHVVDLIVKHKNAARFIIENFMIAANGVMVHFLQKANFPYIQRVVPTPEHWPKIVELAESLGDELPRIADSHALTEFLVRQRKNNPDQFPDLSLTVVKLIGRGIYKMLEPGKPKEGHFGLAVIDYTHSTAPNRRYVDIVIQRLIKAVLEKKHVPYSKPELDQLSTWCTERVHTAKKVERFMRKAAAAVLLSDHIGQEYEAIVTGASNKGTYARIFHPPVEGRIMRGERGLHVGNKIRVRLLSVDPENAHIDFERAR
jgi:exoribonuclease-2